MTYNTHKYPQNLWAKLINTELAHLTNEVSKDASIVDAPCGNGIIASFVKQVFPEHKVLGIDLDANLLNSLYVLDNSNKPEFKVADIFDPICNGNDNIWLLINSLYCLPYKEKLLQIHRSNFKFIVAVFPDIEQDNYKYFVKKHPDFSNPSAMSINHTINFMQENGYDVIKRIGNTKIKFHIWNHKYKFNLLPNKFRNIIFTLLDRLLFLNKPQYSLLIFKRQ